MEKLFARLLKQKPITHGFLLALSGVCSITLVNVLLPLAMYSKYTKVAAILISFVLTSGIFCFLYLRFIKPILLEIKKKMAVEWMCCDRINASYSFTNTPASTLSPCRTYHPDSTNSPELSFHMSSEI